MSLNFDFRNIKNHEEVTTSPFNPNEWHPVADALVWLSMLCGYNEITSRNVDAVTDRIMAYQVVMGPFLSAKGGALKIHLQPEDVRRFVGLKTNATRLTDKQFQARLGRIAVEEGKALERRLAREQWPCALTRTFEIAAQMRAEARAAA